MIKFLNRLERYYEIELPKRTDPLTSSATYNIGAIEGGVKANVVADSDCDLTEEFFRMKLCRIMWTSFRIWLIIL